MPTGIAASVFLLAERTGWSIEYILWQIPISIFHQANHVHFWASNVRVRRKFSSISNYYELEKQLGLWGSN